jgi:hypothetical protein
MWTCPNCAEQNNDNAPFCAICATRPLPAEPAGTATRSYTSPYPAPADPWAPPEVEPITPVAAAPAEDTAVPPMQFDPVPPGAGPDDDHPARHRPPPIRWIPAISLTVLVGAGVAAAIVGPHLLSGRHNPSVATPIGAPTTTIETAGPADTDPATADPADTVTEDPTTEPTADLPAAGGIVTIGPAVSDGRATDVATMFGTYFSGINSKDYDAVGSVLDPAGSVDPGNQAEMSQLAEGTRSTTDSNVTLTTLGETSSGLLTAEVTFQSTQKAGDGPRGRSAETCTRWNIRYTVSGGVGAYRIRKSKATSEPC